jgi:L-gulonate 5-dehydrogenase
MKAAIFDAPRQMHVGPWEKPTYGPDEVLIAVKAAGICAGDLYIYSGKNPYTEYPIIGGHEICGVVEATGSNVSRVAVGQLVVVEPFLSCGHCYPCRVGKPNCCANIQIIGVHRAGGYAEFVVAPATHVHVVPKGVSPLWASFAEPLTIAIHACRRGAIQAGELALILGCGPIGLAIIEVALNRGARVLGVDVLESRLETARMLGAEIQRSDETLLARVLEQTDQEGVPVVIEATGNAKVMASTVDFVAAGGRIVIVGLVARGVAIQFPGLDFTRKEMTILGSRTETNCFPEALELIASGKIRYPRIATQFDLWTAPEVFEEITRDPGSVHKGVFTKELS